MGKEIFTNDKYINDLFLKVVNLVTQARERVATAVNIAEVYTKFHIGQYIVEYEQKGETRAEYGKAVLKELSKRLTDRLGDGWSYSTLKNIRQFYIVFSKGLTSGCPKPCFAVSFNSLPSYYSMHLFPCELPFSRLTSFLHFYLPALPPPTFFIYIFCYFCDVLFLFFYIFC